MMTIETIFHEKSIPAKEKTKILSQWILAQTLPTDELIAFAEKQKAPIQATCIEALEYVTNQKPDLANESVLLFVTNQLLAKAPRIKWESAKVIGNIASLFPNDLDKSIENLLLNTSESEGTVVRWSAAFALTEILKLNINHNELLRSQLEDIYQKEEKNSIKKIYQAALKTI